MTHTVVFEDVMRREVERLRKTEAGIALKRSEVLQSELTKLQEKYESEVEILQSDFDTHIEESQAEIEKLKSAVKNLEFNLQDQKYETLWWQRRRDRVWQNYDILMKYPEIFPKCYNCNINMTRKPGEEEDSYGEATFFCPLCGETGRKPAMSAWQFKASLDKLLNFDREIPREKAKKPE